MREFSQSMVDNANCLMSIVCYGKWMVNVHITLYIIDNDSSNTDYVKLLL